MQIYGILLNICGILLNNRGKNREIRRISWNFVDFSRKMRGKSFLFIPFLSISFLKLLPVDPFSRSFPVVFGRFFGHFWRKTENIGEKWRISEKNGDIFPFSFLFFPLHYTFIPFYSSTPRFSSPNVKSYWI